MKLLYILAIGLLIGFTSTAQVKILFDATKAETAGNAQWVIDADLTNLKWSPDAQLTTSGNQANAQRIPSPSQSGITANTPETYWDGGLSYWGTDCVKKGYTVETLPYNGKITYKDATNPQDLSNYRVFVVCEPNIVFSAAEKTALLNYVKDGGGLFMISDHDISDRNGDGWDSPAIWNDFLTNNGIVNNPFGIIFDKANISVTTTNVPNLPADSLLHGSFGNVTKAMWSNGTTMTLSTTANPTVKGVVYNTGASNTGLNEVMCAYARYGKGKVVAIGDSSPFDDGTGIGSARLYDGYITDANGNHQKLIMNATIWLANNNAILPVSISNFAGSYNNGQIQLSWNAANECNLHQYIIEASNDGINFYPDGNEAAAKQNLYNYTTQNATATYFRIKCVDKDNQYYYSNTIRIKNASDILSINIIHNPIKKGSVIQLILNGNNSVGTLELFDVAGHRLQEKTVSSKSINANLSTQDLKSGMYLLKFSSNEQTVSKWIMLN